MAISISQLLTASYAAVANSTPENQWAESAFMRELERQGGIKRVPGGPTIEVPLDFIQNPDLDFLATDFTPVGMDKTEVLTAASYTPAQLSVPVKWSKGDEAKNPETNQKVALVKSLLENGMTSHDEGIEAALFAAAATDGFLSLPAVLATSGQGVVGGIDSAVETWWRHPTVTYNVNFSDIESLLTSAYNQAAKGSGSKLAPTLLIGSSDAISGFEGTQQSLQRFVDTDEAKAGFKLLAFKTARFVYSQYAPTTLDQVWGLNPKSLYLQVFKNAYRQKGDVMEIPSANGYVMKIYSALQLVVANKSRLFVAAHA